MINRKWSSSRSGKSFNTIHANDEHFYSEIKTVLDKEQPVSFIDPELRGLMSSIGIQKNKPCTR
ncbi:hypothetical protein OK016_29280 [Vibrio chagasii]|nr:hypothetical protein [Vibrio chagasii]